MEENEVEREKYWKWGGEREIRNFSGKVNNIFRRNWIYLDDNLIK